MKPSILRGVESKQATRSLIKSCSSVLPQVAVLFFHSVRSFCATRQLITKYTASIIIQNLNVVLRICALSCIYLHETFQNRVDEKVAEHGNASYGRNLENRYARGDCDSIETYVNDALITNVFL